MTDRRGFALLAALVTLVLVAGFVAVAWTISLREYRSSVSLGATHMALEAAEHGALAFVDSWRPGQVFRQAAGAVVTAPTAVLQNGASANGWLQRLTSTTFLAQGAGTFGAAQRSVAVLLRLTNPDLDTTATLTVRDSAFVRAGGLVSGIDVVPPGWSGLGCPVGATSSATASPDTTRVCDGPCGVPVGTGIVGVPARLADSTASDSLRYVTFGRETWASLTARAPIRLAPNTIVTPAPVVTSGSCDLTVSANWGDPTRTTTCQDYFPIVWATGDVTVRGGAGQGLLLADGDVTLESGARFAGVIVSRDDFRTGAGGGRVWGLVLAEDRDVSDRRHPEVAAGGAVEHSTCAATRAAVGSAVLQRVRERSWTPIYD